MTPASSKVVLTGHSLFFPGIKPRVEISNGEKGSGIIFSDKGENIPLSLATVRANQSAVKARYLIINHPDGRPALRVPEHLLSAMFWKGTNDVVISSDRQQVPLDGPGIKAFYDKLPHLDLRQSSFSSSFRVTRNCTYETDVHGIRAAVEAMPSDGERLSIEVRSARQPDLPNLGEKPFVLQDAHKEAPLHFTARAVARLQNWRKYLALKALSLIGYGINQETYVIPKPNDSAAAIRKKMQPQYAEDGTEPSAHTAVCDFPGELRIVAPQVFGSFSLANTNHLVRMAAIRHFVKEGVLRES